MVEDVEGFDTELKAYAFADRKGFIDGSREVDLARTAQCAYTAIAEVAERGAANEEKL